MSGTFSVPGAYIESESMQQDLVKILGVSLDEVVRLPLLVALKERGVPKMVHDRLYLDYPDSGIGFDAGLDGKVATIFLFADGYQGHKAFRGELPEGISFTDDPNAIRTRLGKPTETGGGAEVQFFGKVPIWNRFDRDSYTLHVQFADASGTVNLVSIMRPGPNAE